MHPSGRRWRRRLLPSLLAAALALSSLTAVQAHALFERSTPAPDTVLPRAPSQVHIWFSEDLSSASKIVVWDRSRHDETTGNAVVAPGQPKQLEAGLKPLASGSYLVLWTSVSADDGHILHGSYVFSVKNRGPLPSLTGVSLSSGGQSFPDALTAISILTHWLELLSSVVWVGSVAFGVLVLPGVLARLDEATRRAEARQRSRLVLASLLLLLLSSSCVILTQAYGLGGNDGGALLKGATWSAVFSVDYGRLWIGRQALALLALFVSMVKIRDGPRQSHTAEQADWGARLSLLAGVVYLYLFAASGHAASSAIGAIGNSHLFSASVAVDWLHFVADALWFGGQVYLVVALIPAFSLGSSLSPPGTFLDALNRFSPFAYLSVGLYVLSGLFSAKIHIPSWYAFFNSIYGRTLIVKILLIGLMMLISVLTVYVLRPAIRRSIGDGGDAAPRVGALLRWLRVSPVLGVGVLLATSVLFYYPVPYGFGPPPPAGYTVAAKGLTGSVTIKPAKAGLNQISITLHDRAGRPVTQAGVRVLTTMLDMVMGTGIAVLKPASPAGTFTGSTELGMGGHWRLVFLVYLPDGSYIQLPLKVRIAI